MILVDTSVWIDHFRGENKKLVTLLLNDQVLIHPFVAGELALGGLKNRSEIIDLIRKLPAACPASHDEVLSLIENRKLYSKGLGLVDVHLLASAMLSAAKLWTFDRSLESQARIMKIAL